MFANFLDIVAIQQICGFRPSVLVLLLIQQLAGKRAAQEAPLVWSRKRSSMTGV